MKEKLKWLPLFLLAVALATIAFCLLRYESEYLWRVQELNLFLNTPLFFSQQMVTSGGLLTWLGTWFTEFFYYPWQGVALLCGWWVLLMAVMAKSFRVPAKWALLLLVPVALLLLTDVELGYWLYYLKLRGHFFAATIGTTVAVGSVWLFRLLPSNIYLRMAFVVVSTSVLYPLVGFYGLLASLLMGVIVWRLRGKFWEKIGLSLVAVLAIAVVPLVYYRYIFYQTNLVNIYWTGLPLFRISGDTPAYYIPYYILVASLVLMAVFYRSKRTKAIERPVVWGLCQIALLAVLVWGTYTFWYKDYNFHKELRMLKCVENLDWEGVLNEARVLEDEPTRSIVMMKNLALFRLGRQGDEMYHYRTGAKESDTPLPLRMTQVVGRNIYYNYGQLNFCYRWCLEDGVEMGWRVEYLKYMTRCALVNGEYRVARKYLNLLKHTRYYGEWAEKHEKFLNNENALREDKEFAPIFHLRTYQDKLSSDNGLVEHFLMYAFVNNPSEDPLYVEQALISALWTKDIQTFWPRFFNYAKQHVGQRMPIHYQEAAYLYGQLEHEVDIRQMPFDKSVVQNYNDFMAMARQFNGVGDDRLRVIMFPRFGKTFYYEYFLIRNQKLY